MTRFGRWPPMAEDLFDLAGQMYTKVADTTILIKGKEHWGAASCCFYGVTLV